MQEIFTVENVKCGGCVTAIHDGLMALDMVDEVDVRIEGGVVTVTGSSLSREQLAGKLAALGYPVSD